MRLKEALLKLPVEFLPGDLAAEVNALPASAWVPHPEKFPGNDAVPLISPGGAITNAISGRMAPTEFLRRCPYIQGILAALGGPWGRSRLMGLGPGADVPNHVDINYYWRTHLRIHIPVITNPGVLFHCGEETVHMEPGECWTFDSFRQHRVENRGSERRVHLVVDTVGSERLFDLVEAARQNVPARRLSKAEVAGATPEFERFNAPKVMSPWEVRSHVAYLADHVVPHPALDRVMETLDRFATAWSGLWAQFADTDKGTASYLRRIGHTRDELHAIPGSDEILLRNGWPLGQVLDRLVFLNAVAGIKPQQLPSGAQGAAGRAGGAYASVGSAARAR